MLLDELWILARDTAQDERDDHGVVELPRERHEVGDQIEGHRKVRDQRGDEQFVTSGKPVVTYEAGEQHDTVGNESAERPRVLPPSADHERDDDQPVPDEQSEQRIQKPGRHRRRACS